MKTWKPESGSEVPKYKQIVEYVKEKIATGAWPVGTKLETQRALAQQFAVNRSTVVEAMDILKAEGLIGGKGRQGTIVINNSWSLMAATAPPNWKQYIQSGTHYSNQDLIQKINQYEIDPKMIRLGTGELSSDLYPKEQMAEVICQVGRAHGHLGYEEPKGSYALRKTLCGYLEGIGIHTEPESILIVSGSLQALQLISVGLLHRGSNIYVEKPSYLKSLNIFQSMDMSLKPVSMDKDGISLESFKAQFDRKRKGLLYTIPTFHNPTSWIMSEKRRSDLLKLAQFERLPILEDDAYRELWLDEVPPPPLKAMDVSGNVLYMGTASKVLAAGLRVGWLVGPRPVVDRLGDIKMQTDYGASSLSQAVLRQWFLSGYHEAYVKQLRSELRKRRDLTLEALSLHMYDQATWQMPKGGFYIWLKFRQAVSMRRVFKKAAEKNLLINPGQIYDFENNQYIRLSYAYASCQEIQYGIKVLSQIISEETLVGSS